MTRRKQILILLGLSLAFGVLIFAAMLLLGSANEQKKAITWVQETRDLLQKLIRVEADCSAASSERRAYIIWGEITLLRNSSNRLAQAQTSLHEIRQLTAGNPRQTAACDRLTDILESESALLTKSVQVRRSSNGYERPSARDNRAGSMGITYDISQSRANLLL